ncbi:MAG: hypothetical protein M1269_03400 [Chloroflexi bacterium]|nr:hypothetical protein [Chloroflexota bacterium]
MRKNYIICFLVICFIAFLACPVLAGEKFDAELEYYQSIFTSVSDGTFSLPTVGIKGAYKVSDYWQLAALYKEGKGTTNHIDLRLRDCELDITRLTDEGFKMGVGYRFFNMKTDAFGSTYEETFNGFGLKLGYYPPKPPFFFEAGYFPTLSGKNYSLRNLNYDLGLKYDTKKWNVKLGYRRDSFEASTTGMTSWSGIHLNLGTSF